MESAPHPYAHLPYRPCVGIMLMNAQGKIFVGSRTDMKSEAWQMPQGGIDPGEDPREAALRELYEEVGTRNVKVLADSGKNLAYDLPPHLVPKFWNGKFRGQEQRWFLMAYLGDDSGINIETVHPEFGDWKWVDPDDLPNLAISFKRSLYAEVLAIFDPVLRAFLDSGLKES